MNFKIAVVAGDGIGPEITHEAIKVLKKIEKKYNHKFEFAHYKIGGCAYDELGSPLPDETLEGCKNSDAVLLGAVGGPKWDNLKGDIRPEAGLLKIRKELGLYCNLRPAILYNVLKDASPLKSSIVGDGINIMVVRELTGGIYFGEKNREGDVAYDTEKYSKDEVKRIAKIAFELAQKRNKLLCSVDKANVLESSRLWRETIIEVSKNYPDVELTHMYVDNAAMQLVRNPKQFDVIVTTNMFGDILSDEASMITGSIGMLPSASIGSKTGLYEPIHGSAPDIAGQDKANPLATILSTAMMFRSSFGLEEEAIEIENAVSVVLNQNYRTADIYTDQTKLVSCSEMGTLVADKIV